MKIQSLKKMFIAWTKPYVWRLAEAYDIRVNRHCIGSGGHPVIIEGGEYQKLHQIPKSVYFNSRSGSIRIGKDTVIGEDVAFLTGKHLRHHEARALSLPLHSVPNSGRDIVVGRECYIGSHAILIGPVTIGDRATIGAGAVVTKDVDADAFMVGIPARAIATNQ